MWEGPGHCGWVGGTTLGQVVLGYRRKAAEREPRTGQDATSLHSSCLDFLYIGTRMRKPNNLFLPWLLVAMVFISATENKVGQGG